MRVGYARVSTIDQSLDLQLARLAACDRVFSEQVSGAQHARPQLRACLEFIRDGDVLVCTKLDRLARSTMHLHEIAQLLDRKNVQLVALDQAIDTTTASGRLMFGMLAVVAQFERELTVERVREGVAKAKAAGRCKGGKPKLSPEARDSIRTRRADGVSIGQLAKHYLVSHATIYRVLEASGAYSRAN